MGEIWGQNQMIKMDNFNILHKIICCGCVLESPHRGDSNTHPEHMILWRTYDYYGKKTRFFAKTLVVRRRTRNDISGLKVRSTEV